MRAGSRNRHPICGLSSPASLLPGTNAQPSADTWSWLPRFPLLLDRRHGPALHLLQDRGSLVHHPLRPQSLEAQTSGGATLVGMRPPAPAIQHGSSPVVTAVRPCQLGAWMVALPCQQVQAAAVTGLHADGPVRTEHLAQRTVTAWLAVPHTVLAGGTQKAGVRA